MLDEIEIEPFETEGLVRVDVFVKRDAVVAARSSVARRTTPIDGGHARAVHVARISTQAWSRERSVRLFNRAFRSCRRKSSVTLVLRIADEHAPSGRAPRDRSPGIRHLQTEVGSVVRHCGHAEAVEAHLRRISPSSPQIQRKISIDIGQFRRQLHELVVLDRVEPSHVPMSLIARPAAIADARRETPARIDGVDMRIEA